jgi:hypothetical protein
MSSNFRKIERLAFGLVLALCLQACGEAESPSVTEPLQDGQMLTLEAIFKDKTYEP